ncbi:hypothetical protein MY11210_008834 [Beauveria gryllotalpidicola]
MPLHSAAPWSWQTLSIEVRSIILDAITSQKNPGWGSQAAVCKEWQRALEPVNFQKLKLRAPCLDDFRRIVSKESGLRVLVRHICLDVELPRYTPSCCSQAQNTCEDASYPVEWVFAELLEILSGWERKGDLLLELNVYSPSDCEHWFQNIHLSSDEVERSITTEPMLDVWKNGIPYHDPRHGWDEGRQWRRAPADSIRRLFRPIQLTSEYRPRVKAVTCLVIRRQLRRSISPQGVERILRGLEGVETVWYERWDPYNGSIQEIRELSEMRM